VVAGFSDARGNADFALARYHAITCRGTVLTRISTAGNDVISGDTLPSNTWQFSTASGKIPERCTLALFLLLSIVTYCTVSGYQDARAYAIRSSLAHGGHKVCRPQQLYTPFKQ
jgi:hypothetical protein